MRRSLSAAYGSRSPERCPVAFSFATAWLRLTPIRWTRPDARISSLSATRRGSSAPGAGVFSWVAARTACAA